MDHPAGYIDLDRRFRKLDDSARSEDLALNSYRADSSNIPVDLGWNELLEEKLVIILGEPGSGKSWEIRHRCAATKAQSEYAFFVELERLVWEPFHDVLSPEDQSLFQQWKSSDKHARFFLDSVDEAKLRKQSDFHTALDRMRNEIGSAALERARIVISSRISEWRPETDRQEVLSRFGSVGPQKQRERKSETTESEPTAATLLIAQIEPLDRNRVRTFVEGRGLADPDKFVTALDTHSAWEFAGRPLDVLDLAEFWMANGRLGNLTEVIDNDVRVKLKETSQRLNTSVLSEAKARHGAETLATATMLCQQQQFKVPDETFVAPKALNAMSCLPAEWQAEDVNALLTRALFDSATYGQVRFHHRRVVEYLAARWFSKRMEEGCPIRALEQVLFADSDGRRMLRRSLAPVTAWLCNGNDGWNEDIRSWVLEAAPEIHLEYGDAAALPLEYRRSLLKAWVQRNAGRKRVWVRSSPDALRRLSDARLASDISELLVDDTTSVDVREELIQLVRFGDLTGCLPDLLAIITSPATPEGLKCYAMAAVRDIGTPESLREVWENIRQTPAISSRLCALACEALFPGAIGPQELVKLFRTTSNDSEKSIELPWGIEQHLNSLLPLHQSGMLLAELNRLVQSEPHISGEEAPISQQFAWVIEIIPTVLAKLLSSPALTEVECTDAAESLSLLGILRQSNHRHNSQVDTLDAATRKHPNARRSYFWRSVREWRNAGAPGAPYVHRFFSFGSVVQPAKSDIGWLIQDIESAAHQADKELALSIALQLSGGPERYHLRRACGTNVGLIALMRKFASDKRWAWFYRLRQQLRSPVWRGHRWFAVRLASQRRWQKAVSQAILYRHLDLLRTGKAIEWLANLCVEGEYCGSHWVPQSWDGLLAKRGRIIAHAVKTGCKVSWRRYTPKLPHEKTFPNQVDNRVIIGLAGLQAMISDNELTFETISDEDARLATRYAVNELNGFPNWLPTLAAIRPEPVAQALGDCVHGEWEYVADRQHTHDVLADLAWEGGPVARLVQPIVLGKLRQGDPAHPAILGFAISLVLKVADFPDPILTEIAISRCRQSPVHAESFAFWSAVCLQVDADRGVRVLEERTRECATADEVVLRICSLLNGRYREHLPMISRPSFLSPSALRLLIPVVYRHVRIVDDIDRIGKGVFSPTARDDAQDFRGSLLSRLAQSDDSSATALLRELLTEEILAPDYDWIRHLLDERIQKDVDLQAWDAADIRAFSIDYETDPKTDRDLFRIVLNRLCDIKHDIEKSDNSVREEVHRGSDEYVLRRWLARKLNDRSRQRFTIPQEAEIDQEQRPDLRAENPRTAAVSIELKWADNWNIDQLFIGLETQLVGQYLRAHNSRHGIYVLATDGRKQHWRHNDGDRLTFPEVTALISSRAEELSAQRQGLDEVRVVGMDFRNPPES